jgi:hypothetical protein
VKFNVSISFNTGDDEAISVSKSQVEAPTAHAAADQVLNSHELVKDRVLGENSEVSTLQITATKVA